jgi:SAM-dependent methyltransferase
MSVGSQSVPDEAGLACALCGNRVANCVFRAKEMMFGTRVAACYLECGSCGCVQLISPLPDVAVAYPPDYYSLSEKPVVHGSRGARFAKSARTALALRLPVALAEYAVARKRLGPHIAWFAGLGIRLRTSILDVGSGSGGFCAELYGEGFRDVTGIDPFIREDLELMPGVWIYRGEVERLWRRYQLITMNHSLEHVPDQRAMLRSLHACLALGGVLLIRIPVADSDAWERYRADWVSLDPPRHLFIHTERSLNRLALECGFSVVSTFRDSVGLQFWGSEQYRRGIPLMSEHSLFQKSSRSPFTEHELAAFEAEAQRLNREGRGDWAGFVLRVAPGW